MNKLNKKSSDLYLPTLRSYQTDFYSNSKQYNNKVEFETQAFLFSDKEDGNDALIMKVKIENCYLEMEIDSGSKYSVISDICWRKYFPFINLTPFHINLVVLTGEYVNVLGCIKVHVNEINEINNKKHYLELIVIKAEYQADFIPLMGRTWINILFKNWKLFFTQNNIEKFSSKKQNLRESLLKYSNIFKKDSHIFINDISISIHLNNAALPSKTKIRPIPFGLRNRVNNELDRLIKLNVLKPIKSSCCIWPLGIFKNNDDSIEIFPDITGYQNAFHILGYKELFSNRENILSEFIGCKYFCKMNLNDIYNQIRIKEEYQKYFTIATIKGLFCFTSLPFGLNIIPQCVDYILNIILKNLKLTKIYKNILLIGGTSLIECKENFWKVLERFKIYNVKINYKNCKLFYNKITFFGYTLSEDGILPQIENIDLKHSIIFSNCQEFYKFKECKFLENCKKLLCDSNLFTHYDPDQKICIVSAASSIGIAGTLFHLYNNDDSKPIKFFASKLNKIQKFYTKLEIEIYAIIYTIKNSLEYLMGHKFLIYTDQKELELLLSPFQCQQNYHHHHHHYHHNYTHHLRQYSSNKRNQTNINLKIKNYRIQQWLLYLNQFNYEIIYKRTSMILYSHLFSYYPIFILNKNSDQMNSKR
ncbi:uncharacterized protein K02A2.6-like [Condylostylus longicornis]|uniref:uncharacterized protein K02A2.6-like n=1 Tax=Condylostylus longicornis TaxID=2530218 RepID=UPI00244DAAB2|nr:uncharacterized protein K02A2.6-like [Condylostylus longicornis]